MSWLYWKGLTSCHETWIKCKFMIEQQAMIAVATQIGLALLQVLEDAIKDFEHILMHKKLTLTQRRGVGWANKRAQNY